MRGGPKVWLGSLHHAEPKIFLTWYCLGVKHLVLTFSWKWYAICTTCNRWEIVSGKGAVQCHTYSANKLATACGDYDRQHALRECVSFAYSLVRRLTPSVVHLLVSVRIDDTLTLRIGALCLALLDCQQDWCQLLSGGCNCRRQVSSSRLGDDRSHYFELGALYLASLSLCSIQRRELEEVEYTFFKVYSAFPQTIVQNFPW